MKRKKEKELILDKEGSKDLPAIVPMLCGAVTLICLTVSLMVAFPAMTRSDDLSYEITDDASTADDQNPSSSNQDNQDDQNPNDFMNDFNSSNHVFGEENIGYDIFVD
ncbi:MAG: hypothetical protein HFE77_06250 [Clostridiales bacterium]|nr:hypothetical protein [Clostridiales bacterium]